jgi:hypothetical protein
MLPRFFSVPSSLKLVLMQKNLAFYGCKAALVNDAASLLRALDEANGDASLVAE